MKKILSVLLIAGLAIMLNSCKKAADKVAPTACFSINPASDIHTGATVTFNSDCSENADTFSWDFGDGQNSTDASPTHVYSNAGDFTVKLTVKTSSGLSNSTSQTITVIGTPMACFSYTPGTGNHVGDEISFDASCSANATTYNWDFGDGNKGTGATTTHAFATAGDFKVILQISDTTGVSDTTSQVVTVSSAVETHEGNINANEEWKAGMHEITGEVYVDGATLTIDPGAIVKFDQGTGLFIGYNGGTAGATLIANGTADQPILFTSSATNKTPGDWEYIGFYSGASNNNSMKFCTVEYAGSSQDYGEIDIEGTSVTIENSYIQHSMSKGITVDQTGKFNSFTADTLRNNASYDIALFGANANTIGLNNGMMSNTNVYVEAGDPYSLSDGTWNKLNCTYILDGDLYIESSTGAKLTLAPGVKVALSQNSEIDVGYDSNTFGTLVANGSADDSVYITSSAAEGNKTAGDWGYIGFWSGAGSSSSFTYTSVTYGGGNTNEPGEIYIDGAKVGISNSRISESLKSGVHCLDNGGFSGFTNNVIEDNGTYPVVIGAKNVSTIGTGNTYTGAGIYVDAAVISTDATWTPQSIPYIISGDLYVESSAGNTLTLPAGTTLKFTQGSEIDVGYDSNTAGKLVAQGTADSPIIFTSAAPSGNESAGDWGYIGFWSGTESGSILDHCTISYGGGSGNEPGNIYVTDVVSGRLTISNCQITNSSSYGVFTDSGTAPDVSTDTFSNNASGDTN